MKSLIIVLARNQAMDHILVLNLVIGVFAGVLAGMFGIGGGVVIVPALMLLTGLTQTQANGTSLLALLLPVGIFAVIQYYKKGFLQIKTSLIIAFGLFAGVWFGSEFALYVSPKLLKLLYSIFLLYVVWSFSNPTEFIYKSILKKEYQKPQKSQKEIKPRTLLFLTILLGILAGVLSGMFGIGGGIIIVPFLVTFMNFDPKEAIGTSLGALLLPVGLPGVIAYYNAGDLNIGYALTVALGLLFGAIAGAKISISLSPVMMKRIYSIFLLIISINFIIESLIK